MRRWFGPCHGAWAVVALMFGMKTAAVAQDGLLVFPPVRGGPASIQVDGVPRGTTSPSRSVNVSVVKGTHGVVVRLPDGRVSATNATVDAGRLTLVRYAFAKSIAVDDPNVGATHHVRMELQGASYRFAPARLVVRSGDKVVFHNVSGGPHNVAFDPQGIPVDARSGLDANMAGDKLGELNGPLLVDPGETYQVSFAGLVPGVYPFTCLPHMAMGMKGKIVVQQASR